MLMWCRISHGTTPARVVLVSGGILSRRGAMGCHLEGTIRSANLLSNRWVLKNYPNSFTAYSSS